MEKASNISKLVGVIALAITILGSAVAHGWNLRELKTCQDDITVLKASIIKQDARYVEQMILLTEIKGDVKSMSEAFKQHNNK